MPYRQDPSQDYDEEQRRRQVEFDFDQIHEVMGNLSQEEIDGIEVETEETMSVDDARQLNLNGMDMSEEEAIIKEVLKDGHYVDGSEVAGIHQKYEKAMEDAKRQRDKQLGELKDQVKEGGITPEEASAKRESIEEETEAKIKSLQKKRNEEVTKLCEDAPKYNKSAINMMKRQQLRDNESGRAGRTLQIYRKEKGDFTVTNYSKNRIGEFNKMLRKHGQEAERIKGQNARHQKDRLGYSAKDFFQGDAEHMFKGSVTMSLHAALFLLNKLSQMGSKVANQILYKYALNKLDMDDAKALQKAIDTVTKQSMEKGKEQEAPEESVYDILEEKKVPAVVEQELPTVVNIGEYFNNHDYQRVNAFSSDSFDVNYSGVYLKEFDVVACAAKVDKEGVNFVGVVFLGEEENLRNMFKDMGLDDASVEKNLAENAAKVKKLGLEECMTKNPKESFNKFCEEMHEKKNDDKEMDAGQMMDASKKEDTGCEGRKIAGNLEQKKNNGIARDTPDTPDTPGHEI